MDQELLIKALSQQLDALNSLIGWAVGLALISAWAGLQHSHHIEIFSMKVTRREAFFLLGAAFLFVNIAAILFFSRIDDLLLLVDPKHFTKALTALGTHAWPFNPYAYFGDFVSSLVLSNFGYGGLIIIWWLGYTALALVHDDKKALEFRLIIGTFLAVGLVSMGVIQLGFFVILRRLSDVDQYSLRTSIEGQAIPRSILTFAGIGAGGLSSPSHNGCK